MKFSLRQKWNQKAERSENVLGGKNETAQAGKELWDGQTPKTRGEAELCLRAERAEHRRSLQAGTCWQSSGKRRAKSRTRLVQSHQQGMEESESNCRKREENGPSLPKGKKCFFAELGEEVKSVTSLLCVLQVSVERSPRLLEALPAPNCVRAGFWGHQPHRFCHSRVLGAPTPQVLSQQGSGGSIPAHSHGSAFLASPIRLCSF